MKRKTANLKEGSPFSIWGTNFDLRRIGGKRILTSICTNEGVTMVLTAHVTGDENGIAHLDIPLNHAFAEADVQIVIEEKYPVYDLARFAGKLAWKGDAVAMQRELRDEW